MNVPGWITPQRLAIAGVVLLYGILVWSRLVGLDGSMDNDESFAVVNYIAPGPSGIWFGDYEPNDHVLFNVLAWLTTTGLGRSDPLYRLWAVVPAFAAAGLFTAWTWRRFGRIAALLVLFLVTTAPLYLDVTREARGYGLVALASVGGLISADRLLNVGSSRGAWAGFIASAVLGLWTHVSFLLPVAAWALVLLAKRETRRQCFLTLAAVGVATLAWYAPLLDDMADDLTKNYAGVARTSEQQRRKPPEERPPLPWHAPITGAPSLAAPVLELALPRGSYQPGVAYRRYIDAVCRRPGCYPGAGLALPLAILLVAGAGGLVLWGSRERWLLAALASQALLPFVLLTPLQGYVASRFVSPALPPVLLLMAIALTAVTGLAWSMRRLRWPATAGILLVAGAFLLSFVQVSRDWGAVPQEDYKSAARVARSGEGPIVTDSARPIGFYRYLGYDGVEEMTDPDLVRMMCETETPFTFIEHPFRKPAIDTSCLRDVVPVTIRYRERGGLMRVWLVPPRPSPGAAS